MTITGAIVLYAVSWFLTLLVCLPIGYESQGDVGEVTPGTPPGAPSGSMVRRKLRQATFYSTLIWIVLMGIILSGWISISDLDWSQHLRD